METVPVRYVTTSDGYNIAYTERGQGPALVCLPFPYSHAQQIWSESTATPLLRALSERYRLVYYDSRGQGLSSRGLTANTTLDSFLVDLLAVLDALQLRKVRLLADNFWTHVAIWLAVQSPERVEALVLMHSSVSYRAQVNWFGGLATQNWDYYLSAQVGIALPASGPIDPALLARKERLKDRTTQDDYLQLCKIYGASDVSEAVLKIKCPVLVFHASDQLWVSQEDSTKVAALIPQGRLVSLSGHGHWGDHRSAAASIEAFWAEVDAAQSTAPTGPFRQRQLSERQDEVLRLIAEGKTNREIASELVLSVRTVERHVNDICARLGVRNRTEAVAVALKNLP
jgi:pimeloyl-ACP methyl ester carboxylesterase/DNA-binding CsgD family transcriptional regulator